MKKTIIIFIIGLLIVGCSPINTEVIFQDSVPYPESTEILHEEEIEDGTIILYKDESGFRSAFINNELKVNNSGNAELNPKDGFAWTMINIPSVPIVTFAGVITNSEIKDILVKQKTLEKRVKIIEIDKNLSIWFTYFDKLEKSAPGEPDPLKIEALSSNDEVLWKDGVYEDGFFHGPTKIK